MVRREHLVALVGVVLVLGGCSSHAGDVASAPAPATRPAGPGGAAVGGERAATGGAAPGASGPADQPAAGTPSGSTAPPIGRQVIRTADIALRSPDVAGAAARVRAIGAAAGGYLGGEDSTAEHAGLTLQVPADTLDRVLDELDRVGQVSTRTQHAEDVTEAMVDVQSRIASQRASVDRVRGLLARASSVTEVVQVESELARREADLDSLSRRHDALAGQVAMSAVNVRITRSEAPAPVAAEPGFVSGFGAGWRALLDAGRVLLVVVGAVLPFALVLAVPAAASVLLVRRRRTARRRAAAAGLS